GRATEARDGPVAQARLGLGGAALVRAGAVMAEDLAVEIFRGHGRERGRPLALALAPLLLDLHRRVDAACDELKPVAGLLARPFERERAIGAERPAGRV